MCNQYRFNGKLAEIAAEFSQLHIPLRFEGGGLEPPARRAAEADQPRHHPPA
jgi:hypothetical protein